MHALIIVSHPNPGSFTHAIAEAVATGVSAAAGSDTTEIADLSAEGFCPAFAKADLLDPKDPQPAADVVAEQVRLERADALVLVYPVYWWSFPALLKGWIDRVFTDGWAYHETPDGGLVKKLQHLPVHLLAIGAASMRSYARHGYSDAMKIQIEHGIFDYCGAPVMTSELLLLSDSQAPAGHFKRARHLGRCLFATAQ